MSLYLARESISEPPPVSIIQFSSATRIDQSSLRCLLFANNFSFLLSNSLICFTGAGIFLYVVFLFVFQTQLYVLDNYADAAAESDAFVVIFFVDAAATASREYTNYVNFCFFIQDYSN